MKLLLPTAKPYELTHAEMGHVQAIAATIRIVQPRCTVEEAIGLALANYLEVRNLTSATATGDLGPLKFEYSSDGYSFTIQRRPEQAGYTVKVEQP